MVKRRVPPPYFVNHVPSVTTIRCFSDDADKKDSNENPGVVKKFKQMFKDYWYVLIPVHVATSVVW